MVDFPFGEYHCLGMTQISIRATGGRNSTVLEDGVEVRGCRGVSFSGGERSHGGEDQGQAVGYVLVWGAGQSWCESCREPPEKKIGIWRGVSDVLRKDEQHAPAHLSHLEPWRLHLGLVTPARQWPGLFLQQCEGACKTKTALTTENRRYRKPVTWMTRIKDFLLVHKRLTVAFNSPTLNKLLEGRLIPLTKTVKGYLKVKKKVFYFALKSPKEVHFFSYLGMLEA